VLEAIRGASLEDLQAEGGSGGSRRGPGRAAPGGTGSGNPGKKKTKDGRLVRRSAEDIEKAVAQVVALVKQSKTGLRSEEIKKKLGLDRREVPRILRTAVESKRLKSRGQKRATVYSVR
jgi:hypothetical protein